MGALRVGAQGCKKGNIGIVKFLDGAACFIGGSLIDPVAHEDTVIGSGALGQAFLEVLDINAGRAFRQGLLDGSGTMRVFPVREE